MASRLKVDRLNEKTYVIIFPSSLQHIYLGSDII